MDATTLGYITGGTLALAADYALNFWAIYRANKFGHKAWRLGLIINLVVGTFYFPLWLHAVAPIIYLVRYRNETK